MTRPPILALQGKLAKRLDQMFAFSWKREALCFRFRETRSSWVSFGQESRAQMFSAGITREQRCTLEKCNAYCAKQVFMTCRETQYTQQCEKSNPALYGCDVNLGLLGAWPVSCARCKSCFEISWAKLVELNKFQSFAVRNCNGAFYFPLTWVFSVLALRFF